MPSIRYYDYGVMRRESEKRIYDAQRVSSEPYKRVRAEESPKAAETVMPPSEYGEQSVPERVNESDQQEKAETIHNDCNALFTDGRSPVSGEDLLIVGLLLLALSEKGNMALALVLLYLLI